MNWLVVEAVPGSRQRMTVIGFMALICRKEPYHLY